MARVKRRRALRSVLYAGGAVATGAVHTAVAGAPSVAAGWRAAGRPHPGRQALLAVELALPAALVALQRRAG